MATVLSRGHLSGEYHLSTGGEIRVVGRAVWVARWRAPEAAPRACGTLLGEMKVNIENRINRLQQYKATAIAWNNSDDNRERTKLRSLLNQNKYAVKREVIEADCYATLTISPPPAIGGLVMQGVCPFDMMFAPPYLHSMVSHVVDMIDEAVGVMSSPDFKVNLEKKESIRRSQSYDAGYAFIAMPIDPSDVELEDVLDAIKEACGRCGLNAERVDEPPYSERITDRILESIRRAEFVIVDLTDSKPNVFYEAGYAQGCGKIPIYIARDGTPLEFDLKDYPVIFFENMKQLKDKLEHRLRGLLIRDPNIVAGPIAATKIKRTV